MSIRITTALAVCLASLNLGGCSNFDNTIQRGYIQQEGSLEQVPVGSSKEQVQFVLGTPSTTSTIGGEVYYYISQQVETSPIMGAQVKDQKVLAVYFGKDSRVERIANYGLQDGRVIDFISRKTPTGGKEMNFLNQVFSAISKT
ncbi:MAG: outer membrane protein assembly factor BamE [Pseudomonadota bacterium]